MDGKWEPAAVGAGFVEIKPDYVILLVGFAEHPEEIDRKRAEAAGSRAEERLRQKQSIHEYYHSKAALAGPWPASRPAESNTACRKRLYGGRGTISRKIVTSSAMRSVISEALLRGRFFDSLKSNRRPAGTPAGLLLLFQSGQHLRLCGDGGDAAGAEGGQAWRR